MRKLILILMLLAMLPLQMLAQSDTLFYKQIELYPNGDYPQVNGHEGEPNDIWYPKQPFMRIYPADAANNTGRVVVCLPGGAYAFVSIQNEGYRWAPYFHERGITLAVVGYRLPYGNDLIPQGDVYQAFRYLRDNAEEFGINPDDIGVMGFSAGGHLASTVATHAIPELRPKFQILFYPVITMTEKTHGGSRQNLIGAEPSESFIQLYSNEMQVDSLTPPAIMLLSDDDDIVPPVNSTLYYNALKDHDIPATMHIYPSGQHGWGYQSDQFKYREAMFNDLDLWLKSLE